MLGWLILRIITIPPFIWFFEALAQSPKFDRFLAWVDGSKFGHKLFVKMHPLFERFMEWLDGSEFWFKENVVDFNKKRKAKQYVKFMKDTYGIKKGSIWVIAPYASTQLVAEWDMPRLILIVDVKIYPTVIVEFKAQNDNTLRAFELNYLFCLYRPGTQMETLLYATT